MTNRLQPRRALLTAIAITGPLPILAIGGCASTQQGTFAGVITADGLGQVDCSITAVAESNVKEPVPEYAAVSDGQGRYQYRLPAGTYKITATCEAGTAKSTAEVGPGETTTLDLALD